MLCWSGCATQHSGRLVLPSVHLPFFPVSPPPAYSQPQPCLPTVFFFGPTFDTIGLDSMNELASAPCARCVESSLIKEEFPFMSSPDPHACDFSYLVFCSRSKVSFTAFPFHSILYVPSYHGSTSHCLHIIAFGYRSVLFSRQVSACTSYFLFVVQYSM